MGPKIREMIITPIAIVDPPLLNAAGLHAPYALRTIIELVTDDGISGISEIPGNSDIDAALASVQDIIIGQDPFELNVIGDKLSSVLGDEDPGARGLTPWDQRKIVHVYSAIEVACLDIIGKITGRSVVDLLGGKRRDRVPFAAYLFYKYEGAGGELEFGMDPDAQGWDLGRQLEAVDPAGIVAQAHAMCKEFGFQSIKLKGGAFPPEEEVAAMQALYEAFGPDVPLRFDPNAIWSYETALKYGREMVPILEYLEDPVRGQTDMARLKREISTPLATNMCTTSFGDLPNSFRVQSEDVILSDHHFWGGLRASLELARICEIFDRKLSMHSNSHLGISLAAMVHLGAALPEVPYALDTHYPWQSDEVIVGGRIKFEEGAVLVPEGPGLGVELDRQKLAELHENYLKCGLKKRDDQVEMQKVRPDWVFEAMRW